MSDTDDQEKNEITTHNSPPEEDADVADTFLRCSNKFRPSSLEPDSQDKDTRQYVSIS